MSAVSDIARNWRKYAKAVVAAAGFLAAVGVAVLASPLAAVIPAGVAVWITAATTFCGAVGVWWAKNEPLVDEVADVVEHVVGITHSLPSAAAVASSADYLAQLVPKVEQVVKDIDPPTDAIPVVGAS